MATRRNEDLIKSAGSKEPISSTKNAGRAAPVVKTPEGADRHLGHLDSERASRLRKRQTKF